VKGKQRNPKQIFTTKEVEMITIEKQRELAALTDVRSGSKNSATAVPNERPSMVTVYLHMVQTGMKLAVSLWLWMTLISVGIASTSAVLEVTSLPEAFEASWDRPFTLMGLSIALHTLVWLKKRRTLTASNGSPTK